MNGVSLCERTAFDVTPFVAAINSDTQVKVEMDRFMCDIALAFEGAHKRRVA